MQPVLTLTTRESSDPAAIAINGETYRLRSRDDLSWAQTIRYSDLRMALYAAREKILAAGATDEDEAVFTSVVNDLLVLAVDAPPDLLLALRRDYKLAIIASAFFDYRPPTPPAEKKPTTAEMNATS